MATTDTPNYTPVNPVLPAFPGAALAVTKSDTDVFAQPVTVFVGGAGDVAIKPAAGGNAVTFKGLQAGQCVPCRAIAVMSTNTTATSMVAVF